MKHLYLVSILFLMIQSTQVFAGNHFRIFFEDDSGYTLYFHNAKESCMYNVMSQFNSTYLHKEDKGHYELETKKSGGCFFKSSSYSFQVDLVVEVNDGGKISTENINVFKVKGTSSGSNKLAYSSDIKEDALNKYGLCLNTKETLIMTKNPIYWFSLYKAPC